jgi:endo-1,3-1,4-beta-glycanase ExoK
MTLSTGLPSCLRLLVFLAALAAMPGAAAQQASFVDTFDTFDSSRWYVSDGWANGAHQNCLWSNHEVEASNGRLLVGFAPVPAGDRQYRCGEVQTRTAFGFGTFEARFKVPSGSGLNAAFFTYIGPAQNAQHDEIDFEILLRNTDTVHTTTFVNGVSGDGTIGAGQYLDLPYPADSDFIDYAVVWTPEQMDFYLNGVLERTITDPVQIPVTPQRIFFSFWGSDTLSDWMGPFVPPEERLVMEVDWVAYTAPGEACLFPESVVCAIAP